MRDVMIEISIHKRILCTALCICVAALVLILLTVSIDRSGKIFPASHFKSCDTSEPYLYITVHDEPRNVLKYRFGYLLLLLEYF